MHLISYRRLLLPSLLGFCCLIAVPVLAQNTPPIPITQPTDYAGWMARGRELLAAPGDGENESRRKYDKAFTKPRQAGEAFSKAAPLATTDAERYEALWQAGLALKDSYTFEPAYNAFVTARSLKGITDAQRAAAAFEAARTYKTIDYGLAKDKKKPELVISEYRSFIAMPGADAKQRAEAHKDLASIYQQDKKFVEAALEYEKAAPLDPIGTDLALDFATVNIEKAPPTAETLAIVDRLYKLRLSIGKTVDPAKPEDARGWQKYYRKQWADALLKQKAPTRAIALWSEIGNDAQMPLEDRYEVLNKIATYHEGAKEYEKAQAAFDKVSQLPGLSFERIRQAIHGRGDAFAGAKEYDKARAEMQRILNHAQATADAKGGAQLQIGDYHRIQAAGLRASKAKADLIATQENLAVQSYEAVLAAPGISPRTTLDFVNRRAQLEIDRGHLGEAHAQIKRGMELFKAGPPDALPQLYKSDAIIYRAEKNYAAAMNSLSLASVRNGMFGQAYAPDNGAQNLALQMYQETLQTKNWPAAREIVAVLKTWGLHENQRLLFLSQLEIEAGNFETARPMLTTLSKAYLSPNDKKLYEELQKKLPAAP